ncbi:MAG: hypothetical protein RQ761_08995 [Bacteroidales bacterium]|nr:hypothetical protein [Bacteroidales bacterium]
MKKMFLSLAAIGLIVLTGFSQENELHAIMLEHRGIYPLKQNFDSPLFGDLNITDHASPQNEPTVRISRTNPNVVVAAWRDFRLGWNEPNVVRRIGYSYSHDGGLQWPGQAVSYLKMMQY